MSKVLVDLDDLSDETAFYVQQVCTPLVTCKNCDHCDFDDSDQTFFCNTYGNIICSSHFCSDGERKA
jgi:hypothetical protein